MKKSSLLGACLLALTMTMGSGAALAKTPPDQLIIGMNMNNLLTLDPAAMTGNEVVGIVVNLYDSLVELDPEQLTNVKPALAKSWDISPDGKTLTFHLHNNVKFHSGNPLTAACEAFSYLDGAAFSDSDASGQLRFADGVLYGSSNADSAAEFMIKLLGVTDLSANDLLV